MNVFIYDAITEKYQKKTRRFEEEINKLNLQGKIIYLKDLKNPQETIEKEINNGAKTIILLGNDQATNNLLNILANISQNIAVFIVPIGNKNNIANSLGVENEKEAAFTLSARRIENIKIGKINDLYFLSNCYIKTENTLLEVDDSYYLKFNKKGESYIFNLVDRENPFKNKISPQDNILNFFIDINNKDQSLIPINKKIIVNNTSASVLIDNSIEIKCPATISLSEKTIPFIVGKDRTF